MTAEEHAETDVLAGLYVVGVLSPDEAAEVEAALARDEPLRRSVRDWRDRFAVLDPLAPAAAPSDDLWTRIEASVRRPASAEVHQLPRRSERSPEWIWRLTTGLAVAACLVLTVMVVRPDAPAPDPGPAYAVVLQAPDSRDATWLVQTNASGQVLLTPLTDVPLPAGRTFQFWTKAVGATRPVSLGVVPANGRSVIDQQRLPALQPGQLFEVTLEPYGGSPTGLPTGRILGVGTAVATSAS